jgi:hypothetical protein
LSRRISPNVMRRTAVAELKEAIRQARLAGDYAAAGAFAIRLEQMATRLAKQQAAELGGGIASPLSSSQANVRVVRDEPKS